MLSTATLLCFFALLAAIAWIDYKTMEIPNKLVLAVLTVGIVSLFTMPGPGIGSRIAGIFAVSLPLFLLTLAVPDAFGGGDIKLMAACGLFLGMKLILLSFAFAVLGGGIYGIFLMVFKKKDKKAHFAFGPFLCAGMALGYFFGDAAWRWYLGFF